MIKSFVKLCHKDIKNCYFRKKGKRSNPKMQIILTIMNKMKIEYPMKINLN